MKKRSLLLATLVSFTVLALGVGSAIAATISMSHDYSEGHVDVMLFNGLEEPKTDEDNIAEGDNEDHYVYANVDAYGSNVHAERHSGYVAEGKFAGITLYGGDHATLASNVTASTGGEITSYYNLSISSDYGSSGPVSVHIVINEEDLPGGEFSSFSIRKDNYYHTDVFQWCSGGGDFDDYIMLDYSEPYIVEAYLTYGFFEQESSFDFGITQSMQMTAEETPVPIPGAIWLLGSGLIGLVAVRRKHNNMS